MMSTKRSLSISFALLCAFTFAQQITVDNTVSLQNLIENNLIQGCVEVSNINSTVNGSVNNLGSYGYFERGASNFPFQNGIMMTTGDANAGGNGQNNAVLNDGNSSWGTDMDLETALGISNTLNATSIEFNFISISNQIQFNYILASEEYFGNFPCQYSDGFAFLIREVGSNAPYTNIALVPGTNIPVNTNTVHDEIVGFCDAENEQYFEGFNLGDTNYNGRTTVLTATAAITPNVEYQIKLIIADQTDENYDSAVFIEGNSFNASVDLGPDITTCASNILLDGDINNPQATYSWFFNGGLISSATQPTYDAVQTGNYRVEIEIPLANGTCVIEDDVNITLSNTQSSTPITDYELCDDPSNDGVETFDLTTKDAEVLASVPPGNYAISYHYSAPEAQNNNNPITTPIVNGTNPEVIFVRIEDIDSGCLAFSTINLVVNPLPTIVDPTLLEVCDDATADGFTTIDLNIKNDEITNGQTNLIVTYHYTPAEAATGSNPIPMPYVNSNVNDQVFVSVQNPQTGCISTTTLDITVLDNPVINMDDHYIDACDPDHDGFANFDLTTIINDVLQGLTGVSVTFHETIEDALSGVNPIPDPTNYANTVQNEQIVYIRVEDDVTGCASVTPIEIHTNLLLTGTNIRDSSLCDINNDGSETFDLAAIATGIINDLPDVTITFYETEDDRDNQTNPIDTSIPYEPLSNPQTLYLELSNPTCLEVAEIELIILPIIEFDSIGNVTVCDEDQDGFTTIDLSSFDSQITEGQTGFTVTYFETQADASVNQNPLPNFYTNTSNPQTLFTRIVLTQSGCASYNSFTVEVLPAPISSTPNPIVICDTDQDAFFNIDLTSVIPEVVSSTVDRDITFHNSQADADSGSNSISNTTNYNAQTETIFIRIANTNTGCHSTESLSITVNTLPVFTPISNYRICENSSDGFGDFIFNTKDAEILAGQTGKQVLYYETQADADNRINAIDKNMAYQNTSNPQTIFVRVENLTDQDCYDTSSFTIEVGSNPLYNAPTDIFVCDDISNDGSELFDLSTIVTEISQGINDNLNITFYTSQADAEQGINAIPLQFQNTVNPQQIYVQIDNGTICNSITSFELNVIQVPEVNEASPITQCDDNYDGITSFDLTGAELEILDVRQDDITLSYFESLQDVEADTNAIPDPENYNNISNPQTVYLKVTNTISNCYVAVPIELNVNLPPAINDFQVYDICANDANVFDLTEINSVIVDTNFNVLFSYFASAADAHANMNPLDTNYTYQTNNDTLYARVEFSTTHCYIVYEFNLNVNPLPIANIPPDLMECDDDFDGLLEFDLSQQSATILGNQNNANFSVTYYNAINDANTAENVIETNYIAFDGEIIYARVENLSTGCYAITEFATLINPLPVIDIDDQVICLDNLPLVVSADTNIADDTYLWSTGATTPEIEITEVGVYSVTVTTIFGCQNTRTFSVSESEAATIEVVETIDFSDPNNITITVSGIGDYLYQLDDGVPQESNVFENVGLGYHTITIIDVNGCSQVTRDVLVIDAPKFMTPNDDGDFDTWHISGVETLPGTIIYIFDRYGKLLKQLGSNTRGWDGTYNGHKMPASDYWFLAKVRRGDESFEVKGHFALRR